MSMDALLYQNRLAKPSRYACRLPCPSRGPLYSLFSHLLTSCEANSSSLELKEFCGSPTQRVSMTMVMWLDSWVPYPSERMYHECLSLSSTTYGHIHCSRRYPIAPSVSCIM